MICLLFHEMAPARGQGGEHNANKTARCTSAGQKVSQISPLQTAAAPAVQMYGHLSITF